MFFVKGIYTTTPVQEQTMCLGSTSGKAFPPHTLPPTHAQPSEITKTRVSIPSGKCATPCTMPQQMAIDHRLDQRIQNTKYHHCNPSNTPNSLSDPKKTDVSPSQWRCRHPKPNRQWNPNSFQSFHIFIGIPSLQMDQYHSFAPLPVESGTVVSMQLSWNREIK